MKGQLAFHVDLSACVGCKACQIACKDKHNLPVSVLWRRVMEYGGGGWTSQAGYWVPKQLFSYFIPMSCNHCSRPVCSDVCPVEAIYKRPEDGLVLIDAGTCIACRECLDACPYDALRVSEETGLVSKCTMCEDLLAQGGQPVCVEACPMRALHMGELSALRSEFGTLASVDPLPDSSVTEPSLVLTPPRHTGKKGQGRILNLDGEI